jgi:hypothetical protein
LELLSVCDGCEKDLLPAYKNPAFPIIHLCVVLAAGQGRPYDGVCSASEQSFSTDFGALGSPAPFLCPPDPQGCIARGGVVSPYMRRELDQLIRYRGIRLPPVWAAASWRDCPPHDGGQLDREKCHASAPRWSGPRNCFDWRQVADDE